MKPIRKLRDPTQGLAAYVEECTDGEASWEGFRNHAAGASYRELVESLTTLQRGLCGYCEIDLIEADRQVEHVIPRSDTNIGASEELNHGNLIACCLGGTARSRHGPAAAGDEERFLEPPKRNLSCGQAKGENNEAWFLDPRTLPALPSVTKVNLTGEIQPDQNACAHSGVDPERVRRTIELLGLNVERLRRPREKRWNALNRNWNEHFDDRDVMDAAARAELLPAPNGDLPRFFTTARSYFGPLGDGVLQQHTDQWV